MNPYDVLSKRAVGEIPLSIGTALAIEALKDNVRYGSLWINLRTLYRNIYESVDKEEKRFLTPAAIVDTIQEELFYLADHCRDRIDHIQVYHREYGDLIQRFPKALLRVPHTELQKQYHHTMNSVIDEVILRDKSKTIDFSKGSKLTGSPVKSLIITHYPIDLLSRTAFIQLRLLESYTGAIKSKSQWNSKLTDGKLLKQIPFNDFTIQVFGDSNVLFNRYPQKVRVAILELAEKYDWSTMTTIDRIRQNVNWMTDRFTSELLRGFF